MKKYLFLFASCSMAILFTVVYLFWQRPGEDYGSKHIAYFRLSSDLLRHSSADANVETSFAQEGLQFVLPNDPHCRNDSINEVLSWTKTPIFSYLASLLSEYKVNHSRWKKMFVDGDLSVRTLTWYCYHRCGGIGDRIRGIGFALLLAMMSDRLLLVEWSSPPMPERQTDMFVPGEIDWNLNKSLILKHNIHRSPGMFATTSVSVAKIVKIIEQHVLSHQEQHVSIKTNLQMANFASMYSKFGPDAKRLFMEKNFQQLASFVKGGTVQKRFVSSVVTHFLFKFDHSVLEKAQQISNEMNISEEQRYVAVHIRTGFFGTLNETRYDFIKYHKASSWKALLDCAIRHSQRLGPDVPIFLFTDSDIVKLWTVKQYNGRIVPFPRRAAHVDKMGKGGQDIISNESETAAELAIISRASVLVRGYRSGFSTVGLDLCPFSASNVLNMEKCTKSK